jgi:hypothetical protein
MVNCWVTVCSNFIVQHLVLRWHRNAFNNLIYKNKIHQWPPIEVQLGDAARPPFNHVTSPAKHIAPFSGAAHGFIGCSAAVGIDIMHWRNLSAHSNTLVQ